MTKLQGRLIVAASIVAGLAGVALIVIILATVLVMSDRAQARDDGRYAASPLKSWFDSLKSGKGPCCSDTDGSALSDVDWETKNGHYRVRIDDRWWSVPDEAVLNQPNLAGRTMVWPIPYHGLDGKIDRIEVRCFIVGTMI